MSVMTTSTCSMSHTVTHLTSPAPLHRPPQGCGSAMSIPGETGPREAKRGVHLGSRQVAGRLPDNHSRQSTASRRTRLKAPVMQPNSCSMAHGEPPPKPSFLMLPAPIYALPSPPCSWQGLVPLNSRTDPTTKKKYHLNEWTVQTLK